MINFRTETKSFNDLIGNGKIYFVPKYQRDYAWTKQYIADLWDDIEGLFEEEYHYMGYIVLKEKKDDIFDIVDGQQRFVTLSILVLASIQILKNLIQQNIDPDNNELRIKELEKFLGYKNIASLHITPKLTLNKNNNNFYKIHLLALDKPFIYKNPSDKKLWIAFEYFCEKINKYLEQFADIQKGAEVGAFIENTFNKLIFTVIYPANEMNAYKIFETLNARGVKLSTSDLLKNFLFAIADANGDQDMDRAEIYWDNIVDNLGEKIEFSTFLRHYWNSQNEPFVRKQNLFKELQKNIKDGNDIFVILKKLKDLAVLYNAFLYPYNEIWTNEQSKYIKILNLFDVTQCYPLLMTAYNKLDAVEFEKLLRICVVIHFRYMVSELNPNDMEKVYYKASIKLYKDEIKTVKEIFEELKEIYVSDEKFRNDFKVKSIKTKNTKNKDLLKYILLNIEKNLSNIDIDEHQESIATIEHILPENPTAEWLEVFDKNYEDIVYRIGNLTLIERSKNKDCGNHIFDIKKEIYKTSSYKMTNKLDSDFEKLTRNEIEIRQLELAKIATSVWRIDF
jgi:uncharacterized protein with ParB-like and HNH nuclease domain